jgi:hypothetical protein
MTALFAMNLSQRTEVERTKAGKRRQRKAILFGYSHQRMQALRLFFDCAAYFSQVFAKRITRIACSLLQI